MPKTYDLIEDSERCYRAVLGKDRRFDGVFFTAVRTTGIYCRPSCPAITPRRANVTFYRTAAAAQGAGYRACRRCRPDLTAGSPDWDVRADVSGRAMRMIADGVVEREGVEGLAVRSGYSVRHLTRVLTRHLGAGPLALARAQRAHTARILVETTDMKLADVAFAAGFASVRQFNATMQQVYAATPSMLRAGRRQGLTGAAAGIVRLSLAVRAPFDGASLLRFLRPRCLTGVEECTDTTYARTVRLPHGMGQVRLTPRTDRVECELTLTDLRDLSSAVERSRRLLDLDSDPTQIDDQLASDELLRPWVLKRPGVRVPGHVDGFEVAVRAVVGQQISVAGARTIVSQLVARYGDELPLGAGPAGYGRLTHVFPTAAVIAGVDPESLPMPRARGRCLVGLAQAVDEGSVVLDRSADRREVRKALLSLPGVGPWTADYVALRALGDPDIFLPTDLGVRKAMAQLGFTGDTAALVERANAWRPWRSYALMQVWMMLEEEWK